MTEALTCTGGPDRALELQTLLLELDDVVRRIDAGAIPEQPARRPADGTDDVTDDVATADASDVADLAAAIDAVHEVVGELFRRDRAHLQPMPRWLMPTAPGDGRIASPGGLRLLDERLRQLPGQWIQVAEQLTKREQWYLLPQVAKMWHEVVTAKPLGPRPLHDGDTTLAVWVPVVDLRSHNGLLVRLTLEGLPITGTNGPQVRGGEGYVKARFREGVARGHAEALALACRLGVRDDEQQRWQRLEIRAVSGARRNQPLDDTSAGAPVAAALLGRMLGVPAGPGLVSGEISAAGTVAPLDDEQFAAKSAAAACHGFTLLRPDGDTDLAALGTALWGTGWKTARQRCALDRLEREGCVVRELTRAPEHVQALGGRSLRVVRLPLADRIANRLRDGASVVVVGGARASSRSTSSAQAATAFATERGRRVLKIGFPEGRLPTRSVLHSTFRFARGAFGIDETEGVVILLEDLVPHEGATNLDAVLPVVAAEVNAHVIAICLYTGGSRWSTDRVATVPAVKSHDEVIGFAERLLAANDLPAPRPGRLGVLRQAADGDLGLLAALLVTDDPGDDGTTAVAEIRRAWCRRLLHGASSDELAELRAIAACSLLDVAVPGSMLTDTTRLEALGATRDRASRWQLPASISRGLLALGSPDSYAEPEWIGNSNAKYKALTAFLAPRLESYDRRVTNLVTALLAGSLTTDQRLNRRLVTFLGNYLSTVVLDNARPDAIARVLLASDLEWKDLRTRLLMALLVGVRDRGWEKLTITEASLALSALRAHRDEVFRSTETERLYTQVMSTVGDGLVPVVASADPFCAALLIHELGRFHEAETNRDIGRLALVAAQRCDETSFVDHEAAVSLFDAVERYHAGDDRQTMIKRFARNRGIVRLLRHDPAAHAGLVLAQAAVQRWIEPVGEVADEVLMRQCAVKVRRLLGPSGLIRVHDGLALLARVDHRFARGVVRSVDGFVPWLKEQVRWAAPWESAAMIRLIGNVHIQTAMSVLYDASGDERDDAVVEGLARQVVALGDLKGAGHIVAAVASVDRNWGPGGASAASYSLCERLGEFVHEALASEYRGSVVLATMSALVEAECPLPSLRGLLARCAEIVATEIQNNEKEHGPRTGHLLAGHEQLGAEFVELLSARLSKNLVVSRLSSTSAVAARTAYHRLARVLRLTRDDEVIEQLTDPDRLERHLRYLTGRPVVEVLNSVQAYRETLRDAGHPVSGSDMLAAIEPNLTEWARRLRRLRHPGQLATAVDLLRTISPPFSVACLDELERVMGGLVHADRMWRESVAEFDARSEVELPPAKNPTPMRLAVQARRRHVTPVEARRVDGLVRFAGREFIRPAQAVEFVDSVDRIDPGRGGAIGRVLTSKRSWPHRLRLVADIDNPVHLGDLLRKMALVDLEVTDEFVHRLDQIWCPLAGHVRSAHAAAALLTGFVACQRSGVEVAGRWAGALRIDRIARRVQSSGAAAYDRLPGLARSLLVWGPTEAADRLVDVVTESSYGSANPARNDRLLRCLHEVRGSVPVEHLRAAGVALGEALASSALLSSVGFWQAVGLHCRTLRRLGGEEFVPGDALRAALAGDRLDPALALWVATAAFGARGEWVAGVSFAEAIGFVVADRRPITTTAFTLSAAEVPGRDAILHEVDTMDTFVHLPARWQLELLDAAGGNGVLTARVSQEAEWLAKYGKWLLAVGKPAGRAVLQSLDSVGRDITTERIGT